MKDKSFVKNAADEAQVKEAGRKVKDLRARELEDLRFVLDSVQGRRFVWRYLERCGVFRSSIEHSGSMTYVNEGRRDVGLVLIGDITEANDEALITMMREAKKEKENG